MSADIETADPVGDPDEPILSIEDLEVHYKPGGVLRRWLTDDRIKAVDGVSIDLEEEDFLVLVGESGSGKTTLGKAAVGLERPTGGTVKYRGHDIWEVKNSRGESDLSWSDVRRSLQIIHQDPGSTLNPNRTVLSSMIDPLKRWRADLTPQDREENVYRLLDFMDMNPAQDYASRYPHQLSGGEKQRVALGRALMMNPDVIFADEAISALDVSLRIEVMDLLIDLQEVVGNSYLFVSHDMANARYLAKKGDGRIGVMYMGKLVEIGPPEEVIGDPNHPYTQVLKWATSPLHPVEAKEAVAEEPPLRSLDVPDPADPPSGCAFHTRCMHAREVCATEEPALIDDDGTEAACFRQDETHEYWDSPSLADAE